MDTSSRMAVRGSDGERTQRRVERVAEALRIATVHHPDDPKTEEGLLRAWQEQTIAAFPAVHRHLSWETPDPYRMVYTWADEGTAADRPVLLMAHYDVVPADDRGWTVPPFEGVIHDDAVWGRGALDDKISCIAILQAMEELLEEGRKPSVPVYVAFGGDEEIGGRRGAATIAETFKDRGIRFSLVLDEGAVVARGMLAGVSSPVALIGCGEKGHINVRVTASAQGGHASHPKPQDAARSLAHTLSRLMKRRLPIRRTATVDAFITALGEIMPGLPGWMLRRYPVTAPVVHAILAAMPETDAMLRTTQAVTMLQGSSAANVLPDHVWANINLRLLPGQKMDDVVGVLRRRADLGGDRRETQRRGMKRGDADASARRVAIDLAGGWDNNEAPPESPTHGPAYRTVASAIQAVWPEVPILPYLVTATTDSRHYASVSDAVYRFLPVELDADLLSGIHGVNERVSVSSIDRAVEFYKHVLLSGGSTSSDPGGTV